MEPINPLITVMAGCVAFVAGMLISTLASSCF